MHCSSHRALARPLAVAIVTCALLCAAATSLVATAAAKPRVRTRGPAVVLLQHRLGLSADGVYGPATQRAVRRWQRRHGLTPDGLVGPATWRALHVRGTHPVLKRAHLHPRGARRHHQRARHRSRAHRARVRTRGAAVRSLQRRLGLIADGVYGPQTSSRVRSFQRRHGLTADGIVGPATWSALGVRGASTVLKPAHLRHSHGSGGGGAPGAVRQLIHAANRINSLPYRFGGGHGSFSDSGYDCSGSVSYALHGAGLLGSPLDSSQLMSWGVPGRGRWITVYSNPGHTYLVVGNRRFDTSGANPSRWQSDMRSSAGYVARHPAGL